MQLNVTGHHVDVTTSMKGYVEKKLDRIVRHSDHIIDVHCILTVEKLRHKAEATVLLNGGSLRRRRGENMYAAIDALADKLDRRVKKHKEKLSDHHALEAQKTGRPEQLTQRSSGGDLTVRVSTVLVRVAALACERRGRFCPAPQSEGRGRSCTPRPET